jgi:hypothetical protein
MDKNTFFSRSLGILSKLSPFCTYNLRNNDICSVINIKKPATTASGTACLYSSGYLFKCKLVTSLKTAELKG